MQQLFNKMQSHAIYGTSAMETRNHKNGASPKSHTSRINFLMLLLSIFFIGFVLSSCNKEPEVEPYDVTIVFGQAENREDIQPENIERIASQKGVSKIILEANGKTWGGMPSTQLKDKIIKPAFDAAPRTKKEGRGNLKDVKIKDVQDSLLFVGWGFTVNQ